MIVPMKKVSLILLGSEKERALETLRRLGLLHIEISEGSGAKLAEMREQISLLESSMFAVTEQGKKATAAEDVPLAEALTIAGTIASLTEEKKVCQAEISTLKSELDRIRRWGEVRPEALKALAEKGVALSLYEIPPKEFEKVTAELKTLVLGKAKAGVRCAVVAEGTEGEEEALKALKPYGVELPQTSTAEMREKIASLEERVSGIDEQLVSCAGYSGSMKRAVGELKKAIQFETYATGMGGEDLTAAAGSAVPVAYFTGYIPAEDLDRLKAAAKENAWGLMAEDPTEEDNVPTKLKNNKLVSLIYPLTDFLGTVPGYFEYDISGWFLGFILIFFGIIFGDGGYGILICAVAGLLIGKSAAAKKPIPPAYLLIALMGGATILWGTLTCTWFGLAPEQLPSILRTISLPWISNVNADKIWYPFWTGGEAGLTTAQNVQILCFVLALVQLTVAHIKGALRNRSSLKVLGDVGSILQLIGMFYVVLALVVNGQVFGLGLVIAGIPVGTAAIALVGIGFAMSFVFANYEGSVVKSILNSLTNIVSVLLGVVNIFSDIVSYIRLWAVGLAGAAISATVNELAGPLLGNFMFMVLAIVLLVFGHGLNMILNVLSVIVHGIRLNTLEFSSHLDMSWSGHKYQPFEE